MEIIPAWFEEGDSEKSRFRIDFMDNKLSICDGLTGEILTSPVELSQEQAESIAQLVFMFVDTIYGLPDLV